MDVTKGEDSVLAFDTLFTNNHIQLMKTVLPYLEESMQKHFAILIKYMELKYTIDYLKIHKLSLGGRQTEKKEPDLQELFPKIQGYLSPSERSKAEQLMNMMSMMQTVSQFQDMMNMMNAMNGEEGSSDPSDMLMGMLSPEQRAMFEMFQSADM